MHLDQPDLISSLDPQNMLAQIQSLPEQLLRAYQSGLQRPLPVSTSIRQVVLAGMGGSACGASLLAAYAQPIGRVPLVVHRNYELPAWAQGAHTLVIAVSHSGNTEETLSVLQTAVERGCGTLATGTGGELQQFASQNHRPFWEYEHSGPPRSAVGIAFGLMAAALVRLGILPEMETELAGAASLMQDLQRGFQPGLPVSQNRARRDAGQLLGRLLVVLGADHLEPVAYRWRTQINELAKTWAQAEALPEANHNLLAGLFNPEEQLVRTTAIFLSAPGCHPRNQRRLELTRMAFMQQGIGTDSYFARGETRLAQLWSALHYGDYLAYYLAIAYGVNPTPVEILDEFKVILRD